MTQKAFFSTTSGSTGEPKILEFKNKWMGEFATFTNDAQGLGDIFKLCGKFGFSRTMKIIQGKNNWGMQHTVCLFLIWEKLKVL